MIRMQDFENAEGRVDWLAYRAARVAAGEVCTICGGFIVLGTRGSPQSCEDCRDLVGNRGAVSHPLRVRCPDCGHTMSAGSDGLELYGEGDHSVSCANCDADFEVEARHAVSYHSPPRSR